LMIASIFFIGSVLSVVRPSDGAGTLMISMDE